MPAIRRLPAMSIGGDGKRPYRAAVPTRALLHTNVTPLFCQRRWRAVGAPCLGKRWYTQKDFVPHPLRLVGDLPVGNPLDPEICYALSLNTRTGYRVPGYRVPRVGIPTLEPTRVRELEGFAQAGRGILQLATICKAFRPHRCTSTRVSGPTVFKNTRPSRSQNEIRCSLSRSSCPAPSEPSPARLRLAIITMSGEP
eukprot:2115274-Rhodomonas_salina.2